MGAKALQFLSTLVLLVFTCHSCVGRNPKTQRKCCSAYFLRTFMNSNLISRTNGNPCKRTSNQSMGFIPVAPPNIHFTLPRIWGSGK